MGRDRALGDIVRDRRQVPHNTLARFRFLTWNDRNIDEIAVLQSAAGEVAFVDEHDVAPPRNSAIAIIHAVDRRVVLIMASDCRECENLIVGHTRIFIEPGMTRNFAFFVGVNHSHSDAATYSRNPSGFLIRALKSAKFGNTASMESPGSREFMAGLGRPNGLSDLQLNAPSSNRIRTSTTARIKLIEDRIESGFAPASDLAQLAPFYP